MGNSRILMELSSQDKEFTHKNLLSNEDSITAAAI